MSRKPVPAQSGDRSRAELTFDRPQLMAQLFGEYDRNLERGPFGGHQAAHCGAASTQHPYSRSLAVTK